MSKRFLIAIIFMIAPLIFSKNSSAQALDSGIEEILVTAERSEQSIQAVSYTHLTLPTKDSV